MPPKCNRCGYAHSTSVSCDENLAEREGRLGPQKQPTSLARLKAQVQQLLATINEMETQNAN